MLQDGKVAPWVKKNLLCKSDGLRSIPGTFIKAETDSSALK